MLPLISSHLINQQGSPCYGSLEWLSERYDSKVNSVSQLDDNKLATSVLLYVFIIGFPASPLAGLIDQPWLVIGCLSNVPNLTCVTLYVTLHCSAGTVIREWRMKMLDKSNMDFRDWIGIIPSSLNRGGCIKQGRVLCWNLFHWIGPLSDSVYKLPCPSVCLCVYVYVTPWKQRFPTSNLCLNSVLLLLGPLRRFSCLFSSICVKRKFSLMKIQKQGS